MNWKEKVLLIKILRSILDMLSEPRLITGSQWNSTHRLIDKLEMERLKQRAK